MKRVKKSGRYLLIGDLCIEIFMQVAAYPAAGGDGTVRGMHQHAGGSAANTAFVLANLGGQPQLLTHTGVDIWAQQVLPMLETAGIGTRRVIQETGEATGLSFLVVSSDAERTMFTYRGVNPYLHPDEISTDLFTGVDYLHISSYACLQTPQSEAVRKAVQLARTQNVAISLDVGVEPAERAGEFLNELLPEIALLILSVPEALQITQTIDVTAALSHLLQSGVGVVALKMGKNGCRLVTRDRDLNIPGFSVEAVDTTGAGDSFCAGMIHGLTQGWDLDVTGRLANALGALATTRWGAGEMLPTLKEVTTFLRAINEFSSDPDLSRLVEKLTSA